jgi:exodeoxyribonuclease V gamma subunit
MSGHGLHIFASDRLDTVAAKLAETIGADPLGPLEREVVVLQSRGMYRWLTLDLARRLGIAATFATPFPGTFCRALAERIEGAARGERASAGPAERFEASERSAFEREVLAWRLFHLLASEDRDLVGPAAAYVRNDIDQTKRLALAGRLAERFDQYQLYRPELLAAWEQGEQPIEAGPYHDTARWQAALWRNLVAGMTDAHLGTRFAAVIASLCRNEAPMTTLPRRVSVFGAPSLPPIFLDLLFALARHASVSIYLVSPTRQYWADIRDPKEAARTLDALGSTDAADAHIDTGHPLLAALGRQGRELAWLLQTRDDTGSAWQHLDDDAPARRTTLGVLQADIREMTVRETPVARCELPDSRSIEIHVCHSRMREMHVVRDIVLDAFERTEDLRLDDVLVVAPNIADYAASIEAVFGVPRRDEPRLEYSIADRSARARAVSIDAAFRILDLVTGHATASDVLDLLDCEPVRAAAGLEAEDTRRVRDWIRAVNVRWGLDAEHRRPPGRATGGQSAAMDSFDTWRAGLDRLLLGYAMGDADIPVAGVLARGTAAADPETLGRLACYLDTLIGHVRALRAPRAIAAWAQELGPALDDLVRPTDDLDEAAWRDLRAALNGLAMTAKRARLEEPVTLQALRHSLRAAADASAMAHGFLSGGVTFCSLTPMRAIPAKLMIVVGLDDTGFPRRDRATSFDLIAASRRPGDRSPRDDDRYAFLETVLAAGERLVLTYIGRSERDNSALAPSSVLSELMSTIDRTFLSQGDGGSLPASRALVREHALQPFSERYFADDPNGDARLFSFSADDCTAAMAARAAARVEPVFAAAPLSPGDSMTETIAIADLVELFRDPSKHFATAVLGIRLPRDSDEDKDSEPFGLDNREDYGSKDTLLARRLAGLAAGDDEMELLRATHGLAHGGLGRAHYASLVDEIDTFTTAVRTAAGGDVAYIESPLMDLSGDGWRLTGRLDGLTRGGLLAFRPAKLKAKDFVRAWIHHLALSAWTTGARPPPVPARTVLVGTDETVEFGPISDATSILGQLIARYRQAHVEPLPMFPEASRAYVEQARKRADPQSKAKTDPFAKAVEKFSGSVWSEGPSGESADAYVKLAWRGRTLLDSERERFIELATEFWDPLCAAKGDATAPAEDA